LFLDEPTSGLDPESALSVNSLIKSLARKKGTTVFLCTHQLRYAQEICTGYGLISEGSILAEGSIDELRTLVFSGMTVAVKADGFDAAGLAAKGRKVQRDGNLMQIDVDTEEEIPLLVKQIVEGGGRVYHVTARRLSLEEIYFALIERRKKGGSND
jgi:ABC-2 type transport system ATP-binding protein